jgi:hypothetical protein
MGGFGVLGWKWMEHHNAFVCRRRTVAQHRTAAAITGGRLILRLRMPNPMPIPASLCPDLAFAIKNILWICEFAVSH